MRVLQSKSNYLKIEKEPISIRSNDDDESCGSCGPACEQQPEQPVDHMQDRVDSKQLHNFIHGQLRHATPFLREVILTRDVLCANNISCVLREDDSETLHEMKVNVAVEEP